MSDELPTNVNTPKLKDLAYRTSYVSKTLRRVVWRNPEDDMYYVIERAGISSSDGWNIVSKGYRHSTSCYAKLGRITNKDNLNQINQL